jgi:hypothetical protein
MLRAFLTSERLVCSLVAASLETFAGVRVTARAAIKDLGNRQKPSLARCLRAVGSIQQRKLPDVFDQHNPELLQRLAGTRRRVAGHLDLDVTAAGCEL